MQAIPSLTHDETFEQRLARLDLTEVMARIKKETGLAEEDLTRAEDLYRKFLTLVARYPQLQMVPPQIADHVWHAHIVHTRKYMADCEMLFGHYFHHTPTDASTEEAYEANTLKLMRADFGIDQRNCGLSSAQLANASYCGQ